MPPAHVATHSGPKTQVSFDPKVIQHFQCLNPALATQSCELVKVNIADQDCFIMNAPAFHPDHAKEAFRKIVDDIRRLLSICRIAGFLYFTRISPSSPDEFGEKILQVVRAMSGDEFIPCLTFVTTFWTAEDPIFQAKFNAELEKRKSDWREKFGNQALHFYQHGREYNAEGEMTESFINWFDGRNEMAHHIRDMISRRYCGGSSTVPAKTPAIVHELRRGTPIHETEAGRILWSQPPPSNTGSCSTSDERRPDDSQGSPPASVPQSQASGPGWGKLLGEAIFYGLRAAVDGSRGDTSSIRFNFGGGPSSMGGGIGGGMPSSMRNRPGFGQYL